MTRVARTCLMVCLSCVALFGCVEKQYMMQFDVDALTFRLQIGEYYAHKDQDYQRWIV